jgi:hypothetical protein
MSCHFTDRVMPLRGMAGEEQAWKRKTAIAQEQPKKRAESQPFGAACVRRQLSIRVVILLRMSCPCLNLYLLRWLGRQRSYPIMLLCVVNRGERLRYPY